MFNPFSYYWRLWHDEKQACMKAGDFACISCVPVKTKISVEGCGQGSFRYCQDSFAGKRCEPKSVTLPLFAFARCTAWTLI